MERLFFYPGQKPHFQFQRSNVVHLVEQKTVCDGVRVKVPFQLVGMEKRLSICSGKFLVYPRYFGQMESTPEFHDTLRFNPLNSDQHQISPYNINAYSIPEVMRIEDIITQGEFS